MIYILHTNVPKNKTLTYLNPVCDIQPNKAEMYCVPVVICGDPIFILLIQIRLLQILQEQKYTGRVCCIMQMHATIVMI